MKRAAPKDGSGSLATKRIRHLDGVAIFNGLIAAEQAGRPQHARRASVNSTKECPLEGAASSDCKITCRTSSNRSRGWGRWHPSLSIAGVVRELRPACMARQRICGGQSASARDKTEVPSSDWRAFVEVSRKQVRHAFVRDSVVEIKDIDTSILVVEDFHMEFSAEQDSFKHFRRRLRNKATWLYNLAAEALLEI